MRTLLTCSLLSTLPVLVPVLGCVVLPPDAEDDTTSETSVEPPSSESSGAGDSSGSTSTGSGDEASASDDGVDETTDGDAPSTCTDATLLAGNPYFNGELGGWDPQGQPLLADPPLRMRYLADAGGQLAVDTQQEIWLSDGTAFHRIAGDELEPELQYQPLGACADVRFIITQGIVGLPSGNLVVADVRGNGLVELADPGGDCTASVIAGNPDPILDLDVEDGAAAAGDVDGPGVDARFFGVELPIADEAGNIYVNDSGNAKIKRIAADADRTVTTLFEYLAPDEPFVLAMTVLDGVIYASGQNATEDILWAIDAETGATSELFRGRGLFEQLDSSQQATMFALEHDGVDLIVASARGYVFRVSTMGEPLGVVAGMGSIVDYPTELDFSASFPLDQVPLRTWAPGDGDLQRLGSDFVFTGSNGGVGYHLWSLHCGGE